MEIISRSLEKQVIRKVVFDCFCYLAIMDETIAKRRSGKKALLKNNNYRYKLLCTISRGDNKKLKIGECEINYNIPIRGEDIFSLPTVDDYIKLEMILRHNHIRFNKKTNAILKINDLPF